MIIVKIWGGIGNQLFQYVFGQYLHSKFHQEVRYDDNSYLITDKLRKQELDALDTEIKWDNHCTFSKYKGIKGRILRYLYQINPKHHYIGLEENVPSVIKTSDDYFFQGYWQDYKYYKWLVDNTPSSRILSKEWPVELEELRRQICSCQQSVSVHVRRGDYFSSENVSVYGVCTESYFIEAMEIMKTRITKPKFFVFTDDIDWTKKHLRFDKDVVVVPSYEISQFSYIELISLCKHHIISNSSFSWWGAVLNEQKDSVVISPSKWKLTSNETIALDRWMKI